MEALYEAVKEACSPGTWTRAAQLSRSGTVNAKRTRNDEVELRVITKGGMVSPLVVFSPGQGDWSCECDSPDDPCVHVAAGIIAIHESLAQGLGLPGVKLQRPTIEYRLRRIDDALALERFIVRGDKRALLQTRLSLAQREGPNDDISPTQADLTLDVAMSPQVNGKIARPIMKRVLAALAQCDDVQLDGKKVVIDDPLPVIHARVDDVPDGFRLYAEQDPDITEVFSNGAVLRKNVLRFLGEVDLSGRDIEELRAGRVYGYGQVADLAGRVLPALRDRIPVSVRSKLLPNVTAMQPRLSFRSEYDGDTLTVLPTLIYGDPPCARVDAGKLHYLGGSLPLRDEHREQRLITSLRDRLGLELGTSRRYSATEALRVAEEIRGWDGVHQDGAGLEACFIAPPLSPSLELLRDSFDLQFISMDGDQTRHANPAAVVRAWQRGESLVPLIEGGWAPLPEEVLQRCGHILADLLAAKEASEKLSPASVVDLGALCEALNHPPPAELGRLRALVDDFAGIPHTPPPEDLTATLRDYQVQGVSWLRFMSQANLGAMLADDMGLGKTLQALCAVGTPTLVVAPASVVHNWVAEINRFRPSLRVHVYHGAGRALDDDADITVTTYAILRIDTDTLANKVWDTVVLDEAQSIKNAQSQAARAAFELQARFRVTLSGTPVENRLDELWSQFHFLNRGLLGGRSDFQDRYAKPISDGDASAGERLRRRIRPFMLRRLKRDVAKELPPRTDVVLRCTLTDDERAVYDMIRAATQKDVIERLNAGGNVLAALEALLRLRQACCHRGLLPNQTAPGSSKIALLMETLESAVAEGHKALVFSQWTSLLDLVEPELNTAGVAFTRLDGSTRDRASVVETFQSEDGPPVLLVSLKAGGTGLNLTAADHVFLLDPWWNPAVEDQAADRAHRIGQDRPVLVHRLVAQDSVEERMLDLQERKRAVARVATEGGQAESGLSRDDLVALLS